MGFEGYGASARALPPNAVRLATTEKHATAIAAITRGMLVLPRLSAKLSISPFKILQRR
jgi:hypothetical protein